MFVNRLHVLFTLALATAAGVSAQTIPACVLNCSTTALSGSGCTSLFVLLGRAQSLADPLVFIAPTSHVFAPVQPSRAQRQNASIKPVTVLTRQQPRNWNN
ncbi:hypothetical protein BC827DRAFT_1223676 [Russula dissimulans]|nr:hypothetical protein BC827DRAFT_1223676 [Russula dissimulans]